MEGVKSGMQPEEKMWKERKSMAVEEKREEFVEEEKNKHR